MSHTSAADTVARIALLLLAAFGGIAIRADAADSCRVAPAIVERTLPNGLRVVVAA